MVPHQLKDQCAHHRHAQDPARPGSNLSSNPSLLALDPLLLGFLSGSYGERALDLSPDGEGFGLAGI